MARRNAEASGASNTEFHHATIDKLPLPNGSVDCVISNCVINLAPDKQAVLKEIARVLKPGVRLAVSDIVLKQPLPPEVADDLIAYIGCIAGAISVEDYRSWLVEAGFGSVQVIDTKSDLNAYTKVFDPPSAGVTGGLPSWTVVAAVLAFLRLQRRIRSSISVSPTHSRGLTSTTTRRVFEFSP